jgi:hypothetical protein
MTFQHTAGFPSSLYRAHVPDKTVNHTPKKYSKSLQNITKLYPKSLAFETKLLYIRDDTAECNTEECPLRSAQQRLWRGNISRRAASSPCGHIFIFRQYLTPVPSDLRTSRGAARSPSERQTHRQTLHLSSDSKTLLFHYFPIHRERI